jgi:uncharacterized protein YcbX
MSGTMRVAQLWRYPVKSMQGSQVERVEVDERGVAGDRGWGVVDPAARKVLSAKRWGALLQASAAIDEAGEVTITLPDGGTHVAGDPATDEALSAWLDREVRLQRPPAGDGLFYELPTEAWEPDSDDTWEFPGPPGGPFVDVAGAHLLTTASLRAASGLHPEGDWDVRRFRPTALVEADGDGFVEDAWVGSPVTLGGVVVSPFMPTVRCAMPTRAQPGLPSDTGVARTLRDHHELNLGVYCTIEQGGTVAVGDPVSV